MIDKIDLAWGILLCFTAVAGLVVQIKHWNNPHKTWYWHLAVFVGWTGSTCINFMSGDTVFAFFGIALALVSGYNWVDQYTQVQEDRRRAAEREDKFEKFRIDN